MRGGALKDQRAQSAIEFALISPLIIFVVLSLLQLILFLFVELNIAQAARNGAREGATTNSNSAIYESVRCSLNGKMDNVIVNVYPASPGSRNRGDLLAVSVEKKVPVVVPILGALMRDGLTARYRSVIRLEKE
ncbi:MAG: pilus assembly protein [Actinobacteria bacterium]|nr:pilus assembly protein [Actinomycetota bacterium]